jgi:hypothetical protein
LKATPDAYSATGRPVAEVDLAVLSKALGRPGYVVGLVRDDAKEPQGSVPAVLCNADGNGRLVNVPPNESRWAPCGASSWRNHTFPAWFDLKEVIRQKVFGRQAMQRRIERIEVSR